MNSYNYQQYEYDSNERRQKIARRKQANASANDYRNSKRNRKQS